MGYDENFSVDLYSQLYNQVVMLVGEVIESLEGGDSLEEEHTLE